MDLQIKNIVVSTVSATTTDHWVIANRELYMGSAATTLERVTNWLDIYTDTVLQVVAVAEVLKAQALTLTSVTNSVVFAIKISQLNPATGNYYEKTYTIQTPATGTVTATTTGDLFRTQINNDPQIHVAATGTTTLILTAEAGYPLFTVTTVTAGGGISIAAASPAGTVARGTSVDMLQQQVPSTLITAGVYYTCFRLRTKNPYISEVNMAQFAPFIYNLWINVGSNPASVETNAAALIAAILVDTRAATYLAEQMALTN